MNYYKMFINGIGIGIITSHNFRFINNKTLRTAIAPLTRAHCIQYENNFYCTTSMPVKQMGNIPYKMVELIPTTEEEYNEFIEMKLSDEIKLIVYPLQPLLPVPLESILLLLLLQLPKMTIQQMRDKITEQELQIQLLTDYILNL